MDNNQPSSSRDAGDVEQNTPQLVERLTKIEKEADAEEDGPIQSLGAQMTNVDLGNHDNGDATMTEQEMKYKLERLTKYHHLVLLAVMDINDRNSFFRAVSFFVARDPDKHMAVRLNALKTLEANYEYFKRFIVDRSKEDYKKEMVKSDTYADEAIIYATAKSFNIEICVYSDSADSKKTYQISKSHHILQTINLGCINKRHYIPTYQGNHLCLLILNKESKTEEIIQVTRNIQEVFEGNLGFNNFSKFEYTRPDSEILSSPENKMTKRNLENFLKIHSCQAYDSIFVFLISSMNDEFQTVANSLEKNFFSPIVGINVPKIFVEWKVGDGEIKSGECKRSFSRICRFKLKTEKAQDVINFFKDTCDAVSGSDNRPKLDEFSTQMFKKYGAVFTFYGNLNGQYKIGSSLFHTSQIIAQLSTLTSENVNNVMETSAETFDPENVI